MANNRQTSSGGVGFTSLLTLLFIGLKLGHVINWSWWWVLSPTLISIGIVLVFLLLLFVAALIAELNK